MRRLLVLSVVFVVMLLGVPASSASEVFRPGETVIDFEGFPCDTNIADQYAGMGVTFSGAEILVLGDCLNSLFPPHSGSGVVFDGAGSEGVVAATFSRPVVRAGGYVTGNTAVTLECFDAANRSLGAASTRGANYLGVGTPNTFLEIVSPRISRCEFSDSGNTFTVDDFRFVSPHRGKS